MFQDVYTFDDRYVYNLTKNEDGTLSYERIYIDPDNDSDKQIVERNIPIQFLINLWTSQAQNMDNILATVSANRMGIQTQIEILQNMLNKDMSNTPIINQPIESNINNLD